jgi:hypothetical protein
MSTAVRSSCASLVPWRTYLPLTLEYAAFIARLN